MTLRGPGWRFRRAGGRMSGVPNTSIGNSIINFSTHMDFLERGGYRAGKDFAMAVNGDDNVLFVTRLAYEHCRANMVGYFAR